MSTRYQNLPPDTLSVTEVIQAFGIIRESNDSEWYMERGSAIHLATEYYDMGTLDESDLDPQLVGYLEAWKKYRADTGYNPKYIEKPLLHSIFGYCGKLDRDGLDIKSGAPAKWHILQAAAYNELEIDSKLKLDSGFHTVYLQENGSYKVKLYTALELFAAKKDFLSMHFALKLKLKYGG